MTPILQDSPARARHRDADLAAPTVDAGLRLQVQHRAARIGRLAIRSLHRELVLYPKPGLVSPVDAGSHADMDYRTFMRSLFALRPYFSAITRNAAMGASLPALQSLGIAAEHRMLTATGGVNTHKGGIFNLGLLCAAVGRWSLQSQMLAPLTAQATCELVSATWGAAIAMSGADASLTHTHGGWVKQRYGSGGARAEAISGFASVTGVGLPAYRAALMATQDPDRAALQALFALIAVVDDTNLLWRGGPAGLAHAQQAAQSYLQHGGACADDWRARAAHIHCDFVDRRLSPGGAADLLAVTLFLHELEALQLCALQ